jgi:four helix bundle protein
MENTSVAEKSLDFAVRIVNLRKHLTSDCKEYVLSKQLLRAGTSIGANIAEAQRGQSKADFIAKMSIALKEASETEYWLHLLRRTNYLTQKQFDSIFADATELSKMLMAICKSANAKE